MTFLENYEKVIKGLEKLEIDTSPLRAIAFLSCSSSFVDNGPILFGSAALYWVRLITNSPPEKIIKLYAKNPPHDIDIYVRSYPSYTIIHSRFLYNVFSGIKLVNRLSPAQSSMPRSIAVSKMKLEFNVMDYLEQTNSFLCNPIIKIGKNKKFTIEIDLVYIRRPFRTYRFLDEIFEVDLWNFNYRMYRFDRNKKIKDICIEQELMTSIRMIQKSSTDFKFKLLTDEILIDKFIEYINTPISHTIIFDELDNGIRYYTNPCKLPLGITCEKLVSSNIDELIQNLANYWSSCRRCILSRLRQYKFESTVTFRRDVDRNLKIACDKKIKNTKKIILSHWALKCKSSDAILKKTKKIISQWLSEGVYSVSDAGLIDVTLETNKKLTIGICSCGHSLILDDMLPVLLNEIKEISKFHISGYRSTALNKAVLNCPLCQTGEITNISGFSLTENIIKKRLHHGGNVFMIGDDLQQCIKYYKILGSIYAYVKY